MKVRDKVIAVTGASGGIGSALVRELLRRGARVAAIDVQKAGLESLQKSLHSDTHSLSIHELDITDRAAVAQLPQSLMDAHGDIDGVINCAGVIQPFKKINDLDYDAITRVMNINFYGTVHITKALLPHLIERPEAHIANISSMGGFLPVPGQSIYGASKAAVKLFTEGLIAELSDTPVRVTAVFPGATDTRITENSHVPRPKNEVDTVVPFMRSPDKVAKKIIDGIERNRSRIYTGLDSTMMNLFSRLSPSLASKFIARMMKSLLQ